MECVHCSCSYLEHAVDSQWICCEPTLPVEDTTEDFWTWTWLNPESILYWTLSGNFQQDGYACARALCTHT